MGAHGRLAVVTRVRSGDTYRVDLQLSLKDRQEQTRRNTRTRQQTERTGCAGLKIH